jgi:hypothetical protein
MVIAVEPIIEIKEKNLHVRIEDTILVTEGDPVVLTEASPKEVDDLLAFMREARQARGATDGLGQDDESTEQGNP